MIFGQYLKRCRIYLMKKYGLPSRRIGKTSLYAQGLEDMYLHRLFGLDYKGIYVDVGANDGIFVSNTYSLYRQGWSGICIDPNPSAYDALIRHRPSDKCLNIAIGCQSGSAELAWEQNITEGSAISDGNVFHNRTCIVDLRPLTDVLIANDIPLEFDLLSIDVEGMELAVLQGLDWKLYKPRVVIIEYNSEGKMNLDGFDFLLNQGYRPVLINRWNIVMSRYWESDISRVHLGQDWFSLDSMRFN